MNLDAGLAGESTADLNHDGLADLVVGSQDRVAVMMNTGSGFGAPTYLDDNLPSSGGFGGVALADVNVDGNIDIVTTQGALFLGGHGDGTFAAPALFDFGFSASMVRVADFNRDGLPDLIVGEDFGAALVLLNERNGVNHPPTVAAPPETHNYQDQFGDDELSVFATGSDPDSHALRYQWKDRDGSATPPPAALHTGPAQPQGSR